MIASGNGHTPFMRFLLDEGIDPGIASDCGEGRRARGVVQSTKSNLKRVARLLGVV